MHSPKKAEENQNTLDQYLQYETKRYKKKGYGLIFAIIFAVLFFTLGPVIMRYIYPKIYAGEGKVNSGTFAMCYFIGLHQTIFVIWNICFYLIYKVNWDFFERYKINDRPWPWVEDPEGWKKMLTDSMLNLFFNQCIVTPISILGHYITGTSPYNLDRNYFPSHFEVLWQITFFMVCEDFFFYWAHRFLHMDFIYPYIHKIHHRYTNTISIASEYAHPFEFFFANILPTSSGPLLLGQGTHMITYTLWMILRIGETTDGHGGYEFSWSPYRLLPFSGSSEYHNYHHINHKGNYCSLFTFWDRICGTISKNYIKFHAKKIELTETQAIKEKEGKKD